MVSGITPCAQECKWTDYFGEPPNALPRGSRILRFTFHPSCSRFTWKVVFQKWVVLENHNRHRRPLAADELPLCRSSLPHEVLGACP